ncbi:MAG TPA: hypothetical protein VHT30_05665 [Acidimicrobiales bacterium]|nr:hypothetical protein [Acidimicrobiales bacterium]
MTFNQGDDAELRHLTARLHQEGWANHVTVERLVDEWWTLANCVDVYPLTIDDYTNDLTGRDALERVLSWVSPALRERIKDAVETADADFRSRTVEDDGESLNRYFRIDESSGWWWHRRPAGGPLSDYLRRNP